MEKEIDSLTFTEKCDFIKRELLFKKEVTSFCESINVQRNTFNSAMKTRSYSDLTNTEKMVFDQAWEYVNKSNKK